jgi:ribose 1,5-bisphosphokinase
MSRGRLILVVGPSGAGKDTLLQFARARLHHRTDILFPRRVITRPPDRAPNPTEAFESVSPAEFERRRAAGEFALHWHAHTLHYAIPAIITADLAAGRTVVVNTSRSVVAEARSRFPTTTVLIDAPAATRASRLAARNRETTTDQSNRLTRCTPLPTADATIDNDGPIATAGATLIALITR